MDNHVDFLTYLKLNSDPESILVSEVQDANGKTLLHECTFHDSFKCLKALLNLASNQLTNKQ